MTNVNIGKRHFLQLMASGVCGKMLVNVTQSAGRVNRNKSGTVLIQRHHVEGTHVQERVNAI